jgi:hypothetical protein
MANYAVDYQRTASAVASLGSIVADATRPRRGELYDIMFGSEAAPADNAFLYRLQRCTAAGTSTGVTPQPIDPADVATEADAGENHTVEPTYTAGAIILHVALNQRATFRWQAVRDDCRLVYPATAANGFGVQTPVSSAVVITAQLHMCER